MHIPNFFGGKKVRNAIAVDRVSCAVREGPEGYRPVLVLLSVGNPAGLTKADVDFSGRPISSSIKHTYVNYVLNSVSYMTKYRMPIR